MRFFNRQTRLVAKKWLLAILVLMLFQTMARAENVTILLDWFVNPDHGPLIIAQQRGFFKEQGLEVEMIEPADPNDPPKLVAAGKADIAISYQPQLHIQTAQGLPLVRFGTLVATPLNTLLALEDGPVKSVKDLKGRKVGFSIGGFEDAVLGAMLERHGLSLQDVELINVNFSLSPSLLSGNVDAVIGAFRNFELNQLAIEGYKGRAFYVEEEGVPAYDELIMVAHKDNIEKPALRNILNALEQATQYMINHPEEAWQDFVSYRSSLDDELNRRAWRDTIPRFALRPGAMDRNRYVRFAEFLKEKGLIDKILPVESYAVEIP